MTSLSDCSHVWRKVTNIKGYHIVRCATCDVVATLETMVPQHQSVYDDGATDVGTYIDIVLPRRKATWSRFLPPLEEYRATGRLLEIGAGFGFFLAEARGRGWDCLGYEPAAHQAAYARESLELPMWDRPLEELSSSGKEFDVVALWDVIEHIKEPEPLLHTISSLLRPGGALIMRTPDGRAIVERPRLGLLGRVHRFAYLQLVYPANPAEHVYHYTPDRLDALMRASGFSRVSLTADWGKNEIFLSGRNPVVTMLKKVVGAMTPENRVPYEFVATYRRPEPST